MKRTGIPTFLICDFICEQLGVPVNIGDVQNAELSRIQIAHIKKQTL
jgi:hypothetical protein